MLYCAWRAFTMGFLQRGGRLPCPACGQRMIYVWVPKYGWGRYGVWCHGCLRCVARARGWPSAGVSG